MSAPKPGRVSSDEAKWRARDDLRTLQQAKEIQADRSRLVSAKREAESQMKALRSVATRAAPMTRKK